MQKGPGAILLFAMAAGIWAHVANTWSERRLSAMEWQDFAAEAQLLANDALSMEPAEIEAANRSDLWFGSRCQAVARRTVPEPDTERPVEVVLAFVGYCYHGMPVGAVALQARNQGQTASPRLDFSGMSLAAMDLSLGWEGAGSRSGADVVAATRTHLARLLDIRTIRAGALPAWPEGADSPTLPAGLRWRDSIQQETYEALRAANGMTICLYAPVLRCAVRRPAGQPGLVQVAAIELTFALPKKDAVDVLTGVRPPPGQQEQAASRNRQQAEISAAIERHRDTSLLR